MYEADLHIHTSVSDCSMDAEEILELASMRGLTHIAFTDHDTTQHSREHVDLAKCYGITAISGVEMSAYDFANEKKVHILGYGYQSHAHIEAIGKETLKRRDENCRRQIEILKDLGYQIEISEIEKLGGSCIYKQHILDYLVKTGQSETIFGTVYRTIFKNGGPCDFDIIYPAAEDAVRAIKADGGYAVLAHPGQQDNYAALPGLADAGLAGIEWNHPSNGQQDRNRIEELCKKYHLFMTGGSDFHGRYENTKTELGQYQAHESSSVIFQNLWEKRPMCVKNT
ncbi:MAG: PHP domain-containing protein [Hespellia sp.]|nr:PHP domain-containing protein [Hespellia sp.]